LSLVLWAKPIPRHVRFHDLRHTTATLLLKEGVPLATVQKILRHSDPELTAETYGHLDLEDMRRRLERLTFEEPRSPPDFGWSGRQDLNLRPLGPESAQSQSHVSRPYTLASYPMDSTGREEHATSHSGAPVSSRTTPFAAPVLRPDPHREWMTPREVAALLKVGRATVYKLVAAVKLEHVRVGMAIRILRAPVRFPSR
jgi:excisionase family DNA binding protein